MNSKILASVMVLGVALMMGVAGGIAYFSDTAESTNNTFQAGTLDLKLSNNGTNFYDGVSDTWESPSGWAPGESFSHNIWLKNDGNVDSMILLIDLKPTGNWNGDLAHEIIVEVGGTPWFDGSWYPISAWTDGDGSLDEAIDIDTTGTDTKWDLVIFADYNDVGDNGLGPEDTYSGTLLGPGESDSLYFRFTLDEDAMNNVQGTDLDLNVELALLQHTGPVKRGNLPAGAVDAGWQVED